MAGFGAFVATFGFMTLWFAFLVLPLLGIIIPAALVTAIGSILRSLVLSLGPFSVLSSSSRSFLFSGLTRWEESSLTVRRAPTTVASIVVVI